MRGPTTRSTDHEAMEAAALWCVELSEGVLTESEWDEFESWLAAANHTDVFQEATAVWQATEAVGDSPQIVALRTKTLTQFRAANQSEMLSSPPKTLRWMVGFAAALLLAVTATFNWQINRSHEYQTGVGERQVAVLEDGSRVSLDAVTAMNVRMKDEGRQIELVQGRAKFDVAKDPLRPFTVTAGGKLIVAVGTSFSVELIGSEVRVILYEGEVEVRSRNDTEQSVGAARRRQIMTSGTEFVGSVRSSSPAKISRPDLTQSLSWEQGLINFDGEPLSRAVDRMNRYSERKIRLADPALGNISVDGIFKAGDVEVFAEGVTALHPIRQKVVADEIVLERR